MQTLQPFLLFLLTGAGEDELPLWSDDSESNFPAIPSDAPGQVFAYLIPLLIASQENLALLESILKMEGMWLPSPARPKVKLSKETCVPLPGADFKLKPKGYCILVC